MDPIHPAIQAIPTVGTCKKYPELRESKPVLQIFRRTAWMIPTSGMTSLAGITRVAKEAT